MKLKRLGKQPVARPMARPAIPVSYVYLDNRSFNQKSLAYKVTSSGKAWFYLPEHHILSAPSLHFIREVTLLLPAVCADGVLQYGWHSFTRSRNLCQRTYADPPRASYQWRCCIAEELLTQYRADMLQNIYRRLRQLNTSISKPSTHGLSKRHYRLRR